jgi:hypothetical protein
MREDFLEGYEKEPYVLVNGDWIPVSKTEFLNISEDLFGRDVLEFLYEGKAYSSNVIFR